jgi:glycosyltransferase involved in cell wall biosynthesis
MWHHPTTRAHRASRPLTEAIYRGADSIICYGTHVQRFVTAVSGVDPEKVFVARHAVDGSRFEGVRPSSNGGLPEVVFIGQFKPYKGVLTLVDAWLRLGLPARLRLIGNGPLEPEIRARVAGRDDVELVGHVPQDELPAQLGRASFVVLPSETTALDREPWGLVVNEAMHSGLAVVATEAVGAAAGGLVRDGRNGLVVPERDPDALAGAMRRLIEDDGLARRLGDQAREDVRPFNHATMAEGFLDAIEYAIANRGRH